MNHEDQLAARDRATRAAMFAVDETMLGGSEAAIEAIRALPRAGQWQIVVEAALGYLIGHGLVSVKPEGEWPDMLSVEAPEHLRPDVGGLIKRHRRMTAGLRQTEPGR